MLTIASFFAGIGGIDLGFEQTDYFKTIYANEFDKYAAGTYKLNFQKAKMDTRDITTVPASDVPDTDIIVGGFPCQAFSIAGAREGFNDKKGRGELFFELIRIIKEKKPRVAMFENVKNLVSHDNGNTFQVICSELDKMGYYHTYKIMNATEYGNIPQNRERIYIVAFRNKQDFNRFEWPEKISLETSVKDIIDFESKIDDKYYYTKGKFKGDIYEKLIEATKKDNPDNPSVYQWRRHYVRENKNHVVPTLTANQGEGGHNVCIIKTKNGLRKMTPRECFNAQGYPVNYILPETQSDSKLYKQAGNSVCIPVIKRIAEKIYEAVKN